MLPATTINQQKLKIHPRRLFVSCCQTVIRPTRWPITAAGCTTGPAWRCRRCPPRTDCCLRPQRGTHKHVQSDGYEQPGEGPRQVGAVDLARKSASTLRRQPLPLSRARLPATVGDLLLATPGHDTPATLPLPQQGTWRLDGHPEAAQCFETALVLLVIDVPPRVSLGEQLLRAAAERGLRTTM